MTRVEDVAARAGAELRGRFADEVAPVLPPELLGSSVRRRTGSRFVLVVALVMALTVVTTLLLSAVRQPGADAPAGGSWERYRPPWSARGERYQGIAALDGDFYVLTMRSKAAGSRLRLWTSGDGRHWRRIERTFPGLNASVASNGDRLVVLTNVGRSGRVARTFWSDDGSIWRPGARFPSDGFVMAGAVGGTFWSAAAGRDPGYLVRTSANGVRWSSAALSAVLPEAPWHDRAVGLVQPQNNVTLRSVGVARRIPDWTVYPAVLPPRTAGPVVADRSRTRLLAIQFEQAPAGAGGRLWSATDPRRWHELSGFHARFPIGNPDHLVQSGSWWVVGGNRGAGQHRRATMWSTPDLVHWVEMPEALRGPENSGDSVIVTSADGVVVGTNGRGRIWRWRAPAEAPRLVRVAGVVTGATPPTTVVAVRGGETVQTADVAPDGRYALDLPAGRYELRTSCSTARVVVRRKAVAQDLSCPGA